MRMTWDYFVGKESYFVLLLCWALLRFLFFFVPCLVRLLDKVDPVPERKRFVNYFYLFIVNFVKNVSSY